MKNNRMLMVGVIGMLFGVISRVEAMASDVNVKLTNKSGEKIEYVIVDGSPERGKVIFKANLMAQSSVSRTVAISDYVTLIMQYRKTRGKLKQFLSGTPELSWLVYTVKKSGIEKLKKTIDFTFDNDRLTLTSEERLIEDRDKVTYMPITAKGDQQVYETAKRLYGSRFADI